MIFSISFAQNIDCVYTFDAVLTRTYNLCFSGAKIRKIGIPLHYPSFTLYVHPKPADGFAAALGCTLYVVPWLRESVCQKNKGKNRRYRTDLLNGGALY